MAPSAHKSSSCLQSSDSHSRTRPGSHSRRRDVHRRRLRTGSPSSSHSPSPPRQLHWSLPQLYPTALGNSSKTNLTIPLKVKKPGGIVMERTRSGNSILSDAPHEQPKYDSFVDSDETAAWRVTEHFRSRKHKRGKHEDILRKIVKLEDPLDTGEIDDTSLHSIVTTCDTIFFGGALSGRVQWEWSSQERYHSELIGTTALRKCVDRDGYETLIILSEPILRSSLYDRRLLLSAFIHELIHCYLFIQCGFAAKNEGGHTKGWHIIANIINKCINKWVGDDYLSLCNMKANLKHFPNTRYPPPSSEPRFEVFRENLGHHHHEGCSHSPRPQETWEAVAKPFVGTLEIPPYLERLEHGNAWPVPYGGSHLY